MAARFAWVLNLDADVELAAVATGKRATSGAGRAVSYTPKRSLLEAMRAFGPRLAASLLDPVEDVIVTEDSPPLSARGRIGRAFCPTPRALRLLRRAGAEPEAHPELDAIVRANSRAFCTSLGATMPGASFVTSEAEASAILAAPPPPDLATVWRVKRNFGMTGRGQRLVEPAMISAQDLAFVRAGLAEGGLQIEPNVAIVTELSIHGLLGRGGELTLGPVVRQRCDSRGAWQSSERMAIGEAPALVPEAEHVATALRATGYFGPFGVDAYTYRAGGSGKISLQPRSEINARYTMGFAVPLER